MPSTPSAADVARFYLPLPVELFREIITNTYQERTRTSRIQLATLACVSKTFHNLVIPILYHSIRLETEECALCLIRCIKAGHASSVNNAKYIDMLFFEPESMKQFDDLMALPGLNPQTLFFETCEREDNNDQVASSWEARPKSMALIDFSILSRSNPWVRQRMALFSHLTHLYMDALLTDDILSFCLELRTLTHICVPVCGDLDSEDVFGHIHCLLGMPSMELVLIHAAEDPEDSYMSKYQLDDMDFPKGDLFSLLAEIPDERLHVYPRTDMFTWFLEGITPWDLGRRHLTMPWRKAVKASCSEY